MKRFTELTQQEKLDLTPETLYTSVEVEAAFRGLEIPLNLEQIFDRYKLTGYQAPVEAKTFYEIVKTSSYGRNEPTGVAYLTSEAANKALLGAVSIERDYNRKISLDKESFSIQEIKISLVEPIKIGILIDNLEQNTDEFEVLLEECRKEVQELRQSEYMKEVSRTRKEKYLSLAEGNEVIAKNFWQLKESSPWPED